MTPDVRLSHMLKHMHGHPRPTHANICMYTHYTQGNKRMTYKEVKVIASKPNAMIMYFGVHFCTPDLAKCR